MSQGPPSVELEAPQSIQGILLSMDVDELRKVSHDLRKSSDLIYEETTEGVIIAPPSNSPASSTVRAVVICRDIAALLDSNVGT